MGSTLHQVGVVWLALGSLGAGLLWAILCWLWGKVSAPERAADKVRERWLRCRREGRPFVYQRRGQWPLGLAVVLFDIGLVVGGVGYYMDHPFELGQVLLASLLFLPSAILLLAYPPFPRTTVTVRDGELTLRLVAAKSAPIRDVTRVDVSKSSGRGMSISVLEVTAPETWGPSRSSSPGSSSCGP